MRINRLISAILVAALAVAALPVHIQAETKNLALNKTVTTSGQTDWLKENLPAANLTNGQDTDMALVKQVNETLWWIQVDLGADVNLNCICIKPSTEFYPKDFTLDIWTGKGWTRVARKFNQSCWTSGDQVFGFEAVTGRYIRMTITEMNNKGEEYTVRLNELEAYGGADVTEEQKAYAMDAVPEGKTDPAPISAAPDQAGQTEPEPSDPQTEPSTSKPDTGTTSTNRYNSKGNVAYKKEVVTSGQTDWLKENLPASNLTDGTMLDTVLTRQRSSETSWWYQINLGETRKINKIVINPSTEFYPKDFTIDVWTGSSWKNVVRKYNQSSWTLDDQVFAFDAVSCSYIRLTVTALNNKGGEELSVRLCEIQAFENAAVTAEQKAYAMDSIPAGQTAPALPQKPPTDTTVELPPDAGEGNFAWNKSVKALDRFEGGGFALIHLTDGYYTSIAVTDAASKPDTAKWFQVDLEDTYSINTVELVATINCFPKDFVIDIWTGDEWKRVVRQYDFKTPVNEEVLSFSFETTPCRVVRFTALKSTADESGSYFIKLGELAVYNKKITEQDTIGVLQEIPSGQSDYEMPAALKLRNGTQGLRQAEPEEERPDASAPSSEAAEMRDASSIDWPWAISGGVLLLAGTGSLVVAILRLKGSRKNKSV